MIGKMRFEIYSIDNMSVNGRRNTIDFFYFSIVFLYRRDCEAIERKKKNFLERLVASPSYTQRYGTSYHIRCLFFRFDCRPWLSRKERKRKEKKERKKKKNDLIVVNLPSFTTAVLALSIPQAAQAF